MKTIALGLRGGLLCGLSGAQSVGTLPMMGPTHTFAACAMTARQ